MNINELIEKARNDEREDKYNVVAELLMELSVEEIFAMYRNSEELQKVYVKESTMIDNELNDELAIVEYIITQYAARKAQ